MCIPQYSTIVCKRLILLAYHSIHLFLFFSFFKFQKQLVTSKMFATVVVIRYPKVDIAMPTGQTAATELHN